MIENHGTVLSADKKPDSQYRKYQENNRRYGNGFGGKAKPG